MFALSVVGCATPIPTVTFQAQRYRIEVGIDPAAHRLTGRAVLDMVRTDHRTYPIGRRISVALLLHPDAEITHLAASGARIINVATESVATTAPSKEGELTPRRYRIVLDQSVDALTFFVDYAGNMAQDVSAGEKPGEIHNFTMQAHIGAEGVYLAGGYWYPQPDVPEDADPMPADYTLIADPVSGMELAAGAERDAALGAQCGRLAWRSPYPLDGMVLVGGAHEVHESRRGSTVIRLHLKPGQAQHAPGLMQTVARNLDRYEPLIGPYPACEYTVVDNFFSSGFAFPTFTLLSSAVIDMGERAQVTHGYLDHEMLHCWWGNGVHVDPRDGNWCEALASYGANYYGFVLDGDEAEARRKRRNHCHFLSRIKPEQDQPLGTYGKEGGCGRGIAYQKGASVFHMLSRKIGQERFWKVMRRLTAEYVGCHASWEDIRRLCEDEYGSSLAPFFDQWVRRGGAPTLGIERADFDEASKTLTIRFTQDRPTFSLDVPVRVTHEGGVLDLDLPLHDVSESVSAPMNIVPLTVELDPDYQLFRKVPLEALIPTTATTRAGASLAAVLPSGVVAEPFRELQGIFESSYEGKTHSVFTAGDLPDGALAETCVLILGAAARDSYVAGFLGAIEFPVRWTEQGFVFEQIAYDDPMDAILCSARHPGVAGGGVTVLYANSEAAIPRAINVPFYEHSVVVFKDARPTLRRDLEHRTMVPVNRK